MNLQECANCFLHGWKQPDNKDDLQQCKRCKRIKYCGKECQTEHWKKLHKRQCGLFSDPAQIEESRHSDDTCVICIQSAGVEKRKLNNPTNPNYECLYKSQMWKELQASKLYHDHPFPVTAQPGNTKEKLVIVMWNLVYKFRQCQPRVVQYFDDGLNKMLRHLLMERINIWQNRKIYPGYPQPQYVGYPDNELLDPNLSLAVEETVGRSGSDPLQVWKIVQLVDLLNTNECMTRLMRALKDPVKTVPINVQKLMSQALDNVPKLLAVYNQVLDGLASQVISYEAIFTIICGGRLKQACSFCSKEVMIAGVYKQDVGDASVMIDCLLIGTFVCSAHSCRAKGLAMRPDVFLFGAAVVAAVAERDVTRCDLCLLVSPLGDAHRCGRCCTTMYCGKECQLEDWEIHKEVCREDSDERKMKFGREERGIDARKTREDLKTSEESDPHFHLYLKEACEMLENFEFKNAKKKKK